MRNWEGNNEIPRESIFRNLQLQRSNVPFCLKTRNLFLPSPGNSARHEGRKRVEARSAGLIEFGDDQVRSQAKVSNWRFKILWEPRLSDSADQIQDPFYTGLIGARPVRVPAAQDPFAAGLQRLYTAQDSKPPNPKTHKPSNEQPKPQSRKSYLSNPNTPKSHPCACLGLWCSTGRYFLPGDGLGALYALATRTCLTRSLVCKYFDWFSSSWHAVKHHNEH